MKLIVGDQIPSFSLKDQNGKIRSSNKLNKSLVLFFYPKDDTPGCTLETKDFNSLLSNFKKAKCEVYGISKDSLESHNKFKYKYKVKFELLSDESRKSIKAYKTWGKKKFMGKEFMGQIRSTFLIKDNKVLNEWRNVRVKDHAKEVLNFLKENE